MSTNQDGLWKGSVPSISKFRSIMILSYPFGQRTYGYDAHGRQVTVTDARNGTTTSLYVTNLFGIVLLEELAS